MNLRYRFLLTIIVLFIISMLYYNHLSSYITIAYLRQQADYLLTFKQDHYWSLVFSYIVMYCSVAACSFPGATFFSIAAGFLFGIIPGLVYATIAAATGATIACSIARYSLGKPLQKKYCNYLEQFNAKINDYGYTYLLLARLIPIFPFFIVNIIAGLTTIPLSIFFLTTMVGMLPIAFIFTLTGNHLNVGFNTPFWSHEMAITIAIMTFTPFILIGRLFFTGRIKKKRTSINKNNTSFQEN